MNPRKLLLTVSFAALLALPLVLAAEASGIGRVWEKALEIFSVESWLDRDDLVESAAFVRGILFFTIFAVFHGVMHKFGDRGGLSKRAGTVVALALAAISTLFMPQELLATLAGVYSTVLAWALIGLTAFGIGYFLFGVIKPGHDGKGLPPRLVWGLRLVGLILLFAIFSDVRSAFSALAQADAAASVVDWMQALIVILAAYAIFKMFEGDGGHEEEHGNNHEGEGFMKRLEKLGSGWGGKKKARVNEIAHAEEEEEKAGGIETKAEQAAQALAGEEQQDDELMQNLQKAIGNVARKLQELQEPQATPSERQGHFQALANHLNALITQLDALKQRAPAEVERHALVEALANQARRTLEEEQNRLKSALRKTTDAQERANLEGNLRSLNVEETEIERAQRAAQTAMTKNKRVAQEQDELERLLKETIKNVGQIVNDINTGADRANINNRIAAIKQDFFRSVYRKVVETNKHRELRREALHQFQNVLMPALNQNNKERRSITSHLTRLRNNTMRPTLTSAQHGRVRTDLSSTDRRGGGGGRR